MKEKRLAVSLFTLSFVLGSGFTQTLAMGTDPLAGPYSGEIYTIDQAEVHESDYIKTGGSIVNEGLIKGDLMGLAQEILSSGIIEGDMLGGAINLELGGEISGNVRAFGEMTRLNGTIGRNVMLYGSNIALGNTSRVDGNVYLFGGIMTLSGVIKGNAHLFGTDITLSGTYEKDVVVHDMTENSSFRILPGTVIKGKLTYKGVADYNFPNGVEVGEYEYIAIDPVSRQPDRTLSIWAAVKWVLTMGLYYLIGLGLYKLFPWFFERSGALIAEKPVAVAGTGVAAFGSIVGGSILLFILLLLTLALFRGIVFLAAAGLLGLVVLIVTLFAGLPVSLWLGNRLLKRGSLAARLAVGLGSITGVQILLELMSALGGLGLITGIMRFLVHGGIWLFGTGAILQSLRKMAVAANVQAGLEYGVPETLDDSGNPNRF